MQDFNENYMPQTPTYEQSSEQPDLRQLFIDRINGKIQDINLARNIDDEILDKIGQRVCEDYRLDKESREDWEKIMDSALKLARQMGERRTWAGEAVADVKYPILSIAAIQFSARAYPNIVKGRDVVKCQTIGEDRGGAKAQKAENIRQYMNYQILEEMEGWEDGMDKLLAALPILGLYYKKTYSKSAEKVAQSDIVSPEDLVVNYYAKSLEPRATHIIELSPNDIVERVRREVFLDIDFGKANKIKDESEEIGNGDNRIEDEDAPHIFLEQHRWWDLDEDGYQEPYVITVHRDTEKVVRITARFGIDDVEINDNNEIVKIKPFQHFTKYSFFPAFDGSFYDIGWGILLFPINETINSTINQLLDAGTLNNRQCGFIGRGIRLTKGGATSELRFKMGEWKMVENVGDDLRKGIVPLPTKPPSPILFKLMALMIDASKELASQADVLTGEQPKANVPATTTLALIEQGLKVFSGVYKRIHRSLKEEFNKIRKLDQMYLTNSQYQRVLDKPEGAVVSDFDDSSLDVVPVSDSAEIADVQRLVKAEALMGQRGQGLKDEKIMERYLEALQIPNFKELFPDLNEPQKPNPELELEKYKLHQKDIELLIEDRRLFKEEIETRAKIIKLIADAIKAIAQAEAEEVGPQMQLYMTHINNLKDMVIAQENALKQKGVISQNANRNQ